MDGVSEMSLLLDFYGELITHRQFEILDLHYNNDYSLGEIAEHLGISRQGVFDNIKRGKAVLEEYERKLGMVRRFYELKIKSMAILEQINSIDASCLNDSDRETLNTVKEGIKEIIEKI